MLGFMQMDMFKNLLNSPSEAKVRNAIVQELLTGNISEDLNKCLLKYDDIEHHIDEIKKRNRGFDGLLDKAIEYYKEGKLILLDGELTSYDRYKLPAFLLFIPLRGQLLFNINGLKKANWKKVGQDEYEYTFSNAGVELKFILVTAIIMYELMVEGKAKQLFADNKIMPLITQTYVDFFKKAVGRMGSNADEPDKLNYVISKFFYIHNLQFSEQEADKIVSNMYNYMDYEVADIRLSEENIDYTSLDTFVPTMTKLLYKKEISSLNLVNSWANSFGSTIFTEIEYFPALLTHLLVLIMGVEFVNDKYDLRSKKDSIYQRLQVTLK